MQIKSIFLLPLSVGLVLFWIAMPAVSTQDSVKLADQHFKKAVDLLKQIQYQDAISEYEKVINLIPDSDIARDARYWIGQSYFKMGKHDEALSVFEKLIQEYPGSAIAPVTHLMVARVKNEKGKKKLKMESETTLDDKVITDPRTGVEYTKVWALTGKKTVEEMGGFNISANGKFLFNENLVIPVKDGEPFNLVDMDAWRGNFSPDCKKAAFYSDNAIWIVPVSPKTGRPNGPSKKLIDVKFEWQGPVNWSPDSEKIVFKRREGEFQGEIWTISVKDGAMTQVAEGGRPKWSPDGKTIVYNGNKGLELWMISVEEGKPQKIMDRGRPASWSPDSKWIVFTTTGIKYHLLRLSDKRIIDINPPDGVGDFFSFSPDGKKMLFYRSAYEYSCLLKVVSTSGGASFELGRELKLWPYVHNWSPDSKMILTIGGYPIDMKYRNDLDFWLIPLAGGDARSIELDVSGASKPQPRALSYDGKRLLLFENQGEGKEDLFVVPVSLKDAQPTGPAVMVFKERDKKPVGFGRRDEWAWSPDGKNLALVHGGDIWITSADNGNPVRITKKPDPETWPVWSPDGKKIAYIEEFNNKKTGEEEQILRVIPATGGEAKKIVNISYKEAFDWSPNGKELAVFSEGKISVFPVSGGKAREIIDLEKFKISDVINLSWLPDGKHFVIIGKMDTSYGMYLVSAKGDEVLELAADDKGWKNSIYPSPDGKWISYDSEGSIKVRSESSLWEVDFEDLIKKEIK